MVKRFAEERVRSMKSVTDILNISFSTPIQFCFNISSYQNSVEKKLKVVP
jgi:hypothetical protein